VNLLSIFILFYFCYFIDLYIARLAVLNVVLSLTVFLLIDWLIDLLID